MKFITNLLTKRREEIASDTGRYQSLIAKAIKDGDLSEKDGADLIATGARIGKSTEAIEAEIQRGLSFWESYRSAKAYLQRELPAHRKLMTEINTGIMAANATIEKARMELRDLESRWKFALTHDKENEAMQRRFAELVSTHRDFLPEPTSEDTALMQASYRLGNGATFDTFDRFAEVHRLPTTEHPVDQLQEQTA